MSNRWQTVIWTNAERVLGRIYVVLWSDQLDAYASLKFDFRLGSRYAGQPKIAKENAALEWLVKLSYQYHAVVDIKQDRMYMYSIEPSSCFKHVFGAEKCVHMRTLM